MLTILEIIGAIWSLAVVAHEMGGLKNCFDFGDDDPE